jgi:hypothetical protein
LFFIALLNSTDGSAICDDACDDDQFFGNARASSTAHTFLPGEIVQIPGGDFSGDPAQIVHCTPGRFLVKIFPRIDYDGLKRNPGLPCTPASSRRIAHDAQQRIRF